MRLSEQIQEGSTRANDIVLELQSQYNSLAGEAIAQATLLEIIEAEFNRLKYHG